MSFSTQLDANQVIKKMYDDATGSMSMVPTYAGPLAWFTSVSAAASFTSQPISILPYKVCGIVVNWTGLDQVDATIQFQGSVDGNFYDNIGSPVTLASASGHQSFSLVDEPYHFIQIVYSHGSNTVGTLSATYIVRA